VKLRLFENTRWELALGSAVRVTVFKAYYEYLVTNLTSARALDLPQQQIIMVLHLAVSKDPTEL
jgi:hypothetical protein